MCGILGGKYHSLTRQQAEKALRCIAHRGPDDSGIWMAENCFVANTRLAIQDTSAAGHQPMHSPDGRHILVYNGELYNNAQLRQQLTQAGYSFQSTSDTETLLHAYTHWGPDCLQHLNGIFAFCIFDTVAKIFSIARDPLGVKPLYYYTDGQNFFFASELKSLLNWQGLDYTLAPEQFATYLRLLWSPGADTPFRHIKKLEPGHTLTYNVATNQHCIQRYYSIPFTGAYNQELTEPQWIDQLDTQLQKSITAQLISDAPVGYFLSGGVDSSLLTAIAAKQKAQKLCCFTIDTGGHFKGEGFDDDLPYAKQMAKHLGTDLTIVPATTVTPELFDKVIWHLDEPQADAAPLQVLNISEAARAEGFKVLMSGAGADDVFSGYRRHQALQRLHQVAGLPALLKSLASLAAGLGGTATKRRIQKLLNTNGKTPLQQQASLLFWQADATITNLFNDDISPIVRHKNPYQFFEDSLQEIPAETSELNRMLFWELRSFLPAHNLNYTDKLSMAAGIETRVPYLDIDVVALAAGMPPSLKMKGSQTKYILRQVAARYLPKEILQRPKTGFGAPICQWIKGEMAGMVQERLLEGNLTRWNIFNEAAIKQLITDNQKGTVDAAYTIWSLLAIESWLRQFAQP